MYATTTSHRRRRTITLVGLAAALLVAWLAYGVEQAKAAYTAAVEAGTLKIAGDGSGDTLALRFQAGSTTLLEVDVGGDGPAEFSFDRSTFTAIEIDGGGGDDVIFTQGGGFADVPITMSGGSGDDTLIGGLGNQVLIGGRGNDIVSGGDGDDTALLGAGDDVFSWNPGDDSDTVEGEGGDDRLDFNGSGAPESIDVSAAGSRVQFTRNVASVVMDLAGIERVGFDAAGGADTITVDALTGPDVETAAIDLSAVGGGGDAQVDTVIARGTSGADEVEFGNSEGAITIGGLAAETSVVGSETIDDVSVQTLADEDAISMDVGVSGPATLNADGGEGADTARYDGSADADSIAVAANGAEVTTSTAVTARFDTFAIESLVVQGLGGADTITGVGNLAALTALTFDGGADADDLRGGNGADLLLGGGGDDSVDGNQGLDRALLGGGDDRFQWDPGDGSDTVEGEAGKDLLDFFGSGASELIQVTADGKRARLTRNVASIEMDFDGIERLAVHALGGTDTILVDDLKGTDVEDVDVDLAAFGGGGDAQPDTVITSGDDMRDRVQVTRDGSQVLIAGLAARTHITGSEPANDTLRVQTFGGNDDVTIAADVAGLIATILDLGADE